MQFFTSVKLKQNRNKHLSWKHGVRTLGELDHLQVSYVTRLLFTARISNVEGIICVMNKEDVKFYARWIFLANIWIFNSRRRLLIKETHLSANDALKRG